MHYWSFMIIIGICATILIFVILKYRNINEILKDKINTINKLECENKKLNNDTKELIEQNAKLQTAIEYEKKINQEKIDDLIALKEQTKNEFKVLSQNILDEKIKSHKNAQEEGLINIIKPLQVQIESFKKQVQDVYERESKNRNELVGEIKILKDLNNQISKDAINLTNALKGNNKIQGNWGEIILEKLLEDSGLIKDREYFREKSYANENGDRMRPDVIIKLPNEKVIIIDSKVSLIDYERYTNNNEDSNLNAHIASIKNHIKSLSVKRYNELGDSLKLDFILMFIPIEGAFLDAIKKDNELFQFAYNKNIILVSPTTLYATLRTIENIWRNERQNKNIDEILKTASSLYDKFHTLYDTIESIGKAINKVDDEYKKMLITLKDGKGSIIDKIKKLEDLGVKVNKKLPL